jgi:hypothetical protein
MKLFGAFLLVSVAGAVAGTAGAGSGAELRPQQLVLQLEDMPAGWSISVDKARTNSAVARENGESVAKYVRFGRISGWEREFEGQGGLAGALSRPVRAASFASVYKNAAGALRAWKDGGMPPLQPGMRRISVGAPLGQQSFAFVATQKNGGVTAAVVSMKWRQGRVHAALIVAGLEGTVDAAKIVALARKQAARIKRALAASP